MNQPPHPVPHGRAHLLKPRLRVVHVSDIDLVALREAGIAGLIFDLDDTLVHALEPRADQQVAAWIEALKAHFQVYVVSNNMSDQRVAIAAEHLGLPYLARARKPSRRMFRRVLEAMALAPAQVAIVGDQLFTDVLGGNRLGAFTILVDPLSTERKWHRKVMRSLETHFLMRAGGSAYHPRRVAPSPEPVSKEPT